ncbi:MAG TPA: F-box protein, partial [Saprospiraceae bacterium]|nr:F-box protein [Saprospiraceae bacterium]
MQQIPKKLIYRKRYFYYPLEMDNLSSEAISIIFEYLDTKDLILSSRTCWKFRNTFRKYIGKYKLDLTGKKITDEGLKYLAGVHTINL